MGKLVKLVVLLALIAVAVYAVVTLSNDLGSGKAVDTGERDERPRLEERYGFTSETVGD